jgi:GT2 family glycosyltransferase/glycosyltransferase involved in cell wall biosynthesis
MKTMDSKQSPSPPSSDSPALQIERLIEEAGQLLSMARQISKAAEGLRAALGTGPLPERPTAADTISADVNWFDGPAAGAARQIRAILPDLLPRRRGLFARFKDWLHSGFDEDAYLYFNPDIAKALAEGRITSPRQHWLTHGRKEGRIGGQPRPVAERGEPVGSDGINLYGFLSSASGLGSAARSARRVIETSQTSLACIDLPSWEDGGPYPAASAGPHRINLLYQNVDVLPRFVSTYGEGLLRQRYNIAHCSWELPSLRADWVGDLQYVDEVWTPSEFNRAAFEAATPLPVFVLPHAIDGLETRATLSRLELGLPEEAFVFSFVFDVSSGFERKNPLALIDAFQRSFGASKDVLLVLKCHNGRYAPECMRMIQDRLTNYNVRLIDELWTESQIHSLHRQTDCLVSPHRSEGFGLNLAETMYFGKAVIATAFGGNMDFMTEANSYPVRYQLVELERPCGPYMPGNIWADPDVDHLAEQMTRVFSDREERRRKGEEARAAILRQYSTDALARRFRDRFIQIGHVVHRHPKRHRKFIPDGAPERARTAIRAMQRRPRISVITPVFNVEAQWLRRCVDSVLAQWYPEWELCLCDDGSTNEETRKVLESYRGRDPRIKVVFEEENRGIAAASNRAAEFATGEFLAFLDNDDELSPDALLEVARAIESSPEADLLYTDEDKIDESGAVCDPYFKPAWSPEHLQSVMYLLHLLVVRKKLFLQLHGFRPEYSGAQDYDLALRVAERARQIVHVPKVLYHWRKIAGSAAQIVDAKPAALEAGLRALQDFVERRKLPADVRPGLLPGTFRVKYTVLGRPPVTLVVLAGNKTIRRAGGDDAVLALNLARSVVSKTEYANYRILVVHDGNQTLETLRGLEALGCDLVEFPGPYKPFNFSRKANWSLRRSATEHIVLMNDDLEVISGDWLEALLEYSQQPAIGAVGGRLLFPDGRLQHAGIVLGVNQGAAHIHHMAAPGFVGYNGFTHLVRNYSAVTAACLATRKSVFEEAGGFDEQFSVDYNDVDFCLKVLSRGYRIVYTPFCELYHFEGQSLPRQGQKHEEAGAFTRRWARYLDSDPYYNPNLTRNGLEFSVDESRSPWRPGRKLDSA